MIRLHLARLYLRWDSAAFRPDMPAGGFAGIWPGHIREVIRRQLARSHLRGDSAAFGPVMFEMGFGGI